MNKIIAIVCAIVLTACTNTRYIPIETVRSEHTESNSAELVQLVKSLSERLIQKERQVDSLMQSNSERLVLSDKGDTLRHDREIVVYRSSHRESELERLVEAQTDSIRELKEELASVKADSAEVPYPVERELSRWERTKMDFGGMAIGALVIVVCIAVVWLIKKFRK